MKTPESQNQDIHFHIMPKMNFFPNFFAISFQKVLPTIKQTKMSQSTLHTVSIQYTKEYQNSLNKYSFADSASSFTMDHLNISSTA